MLIESIRLCDGGFWNLGYHEERIRRTSMALFGRGPGFDLQEELQRMELPPAGLFKCRVIYNEVFRSATLTPYVPVAIGSLKVVRSDSIAYAFKYENRENIDSLYAQRAGCDDIIIVKSGRVTDASSANLVFRRGETWVTPADTLLPGTMRRWLLEQRRIAEACIREKDIVGFDGIRLINAMIGFEMPEIPLANVVF